MKFYFTSLSLVLFSLFVFFSCASTKNIKDDEIESKNEEITVPEVSVTIIEEQQEKVPTAEELFTESLNDISIFLINSPKITTKNNPFSSAFEFQVLKENNPVSQYSITIEYPENKNLAGEVSFAKKILITDENGKIVFMPEKPNFACASTVTVYPTPLNDSEEVLQATNAKKVSANYLVRSDIVKKGAVLFVWDYNEKNRPVNNSYEILSEFRKRGITMVGNADRKSVV